MKKKSLVLAAVALFLSSFYFLSCKKINEATELGGDLIPPIDNVNTFEASLETETDNELFNDTTELGYGDLSAVGALNDPEFGKTEGASYFNISSAVYSRYPFLNAGGSVAIDSVVLSLSYKGAYGDTMSTQTLRVFELDPSADLKNDTTYYKFTGGDFSTTGAELGSKTFGINTLKDSLTITRPRDTQRVANVVRIKLNNSLGSRFAGYDSLNTANGGFYSDSIFQTLFKGLAVKADASGNALTYFDVFDTDKSRLIVYFRSTKDSKTDTSSAVFYHVPKQFSSGRTYPAGVANTVKRVPAGNWLSYLTNGIAKDDKLYIQSSPGSLGTIKIPGLDNLSNRVVHLAELIIYRLPSAQDNIFTAPPLLYLDKINNAKDSAFLFENDQQINTSTGQASYNGGNLKTDNTYRFNITRHVQGVVTRKERNLFLRLYAPLRTKLHVGTNASIFVPVAGRIADGRVVLAGGNYSDPNLRLRLRLVYSNL